MIKIPLVTLITPCYNHEFFLNAYFESILKQTYENIELILIDDNSQDNSRKVIEQHLHILKKRFIRVVYIPRDKNIGVVKNCNEALTLSLGKYIIIFASDDIMLPNRVEKNVEFLEKNNDYGMVYSDGYYFNNKVNISKRNYKNLKCFSDKYVFYSGNVKDKLLIQNFIPSVSACIRKECFKAVGGYNEDFHYEDFDMWLKIAAKYKVGYINEKLVLYRKHNKSMSNNLLSIEKNLKTKEKIINEHVSNGDFDKSTVNLAFKNLYNGYCSYFFKIKDKANFNLYYKKSRKSSKLFIQKIILSFLF